MSYHPRKTRSRPVGLGDVMSSVASALSSVTGAIGTAASAASDPYLSETICHVQQLSEIENQGRVITRCTSTADGLRGGVGLRKVVKPLRAYVYAEQNPWVYPAAAAAVIGVPFLLGYLMGKD